MKQSFLLFLISFVAAFIPCRMQAELAGDPDDPDFIRATLIVVGPGPIMYQVAGHAMIRMECPAAGLDNIFSFESEAAANALAAVFTRVNGQFVPLPAQLYLQEFLSEGREVVEYPLNLAPRRKQRLWQVLDSLTTTGEHPFNIRQESCSGYILYALDLALAPAHIEMIGSDIIGKSNNVAIDGATAAEGPWRHLFLRIAYGEDNNGFDNIYKQGAPTNIDKDREHFYIVEEGKMAQPLFAATDKHLTPSVPGSFTPLNVAIASLVLGLICLLLSLLRRGRIFVAVVRWAVASILALAGILLAAFIATPSSLGPWANWNFLLLNPVPLVLMILSARRHKAYTTAWRWLVGAWLVYALILPFATASIVPAMSLFALAAALCQVRVTSYE